MFCLNNYIEKPWSTGDGSIDSASGKEWVRERERLGVKREIERERGETVLYDLLECDPHTWCAHSLLKCPSVHHCDSVFFVVWHPLTGCSSSNNVTTTQLYNTLSLIDLASVYKLSVFLLSPCHSTSNAINNRVQVFECHVAWRAGGGWRLMILGWDVSVIQTSQNLYGL